MHRHEARQPHVRRVCGVGRRAQRQLGGGEASHRVSRGCPNCVVVRGPSLHQDAAPLGAAACPARHLRHELKRALGGPEVGEVEARIRVHYPDDRHVREVQPLRDHLRAEQDVELPLCHALEDPVMRPLRAGGIEIHAGDAGLRKP